MDPKQCLIDVENVITDARAMKVTDSATYRAQQQAFQEAWERLQEYREWRRTGGFEPMFPTFKGGPNDIAGDSWADHFQQVLKSFGVPC